MAIVPKGVVPAAVYPELKKISRSSDKLGYGFFGDSKLDRVLVRVDRLDKKGNSLTPWYYAPRMSSVKVCDAAELLEPTEQLDSVYRISEYR